MQALNLLAVVTVFLTSVLKVCLSKPILGPAATIEAEAVCPDVPCSLSDS